MSVDPFSMCCLKMHFRNSSFQPI